MSDGQRIRARRWRRGLRKKLLKQFGDKCARCGSEDKHRLEFHHLKPGKLNGAGRGSHRRLLEVYRNPEIFRLVCRDCHLIEHGGSYNGRRRDR